MIVVGLRAWRSCSRRDRQSSADAGNGYCGAPVRVGAHCPIGDAGPTAGLVRLLWSVGEDQDHDTGLPPGHPALLLRVTLHFLIDATGEALPRSVEAEGVFQVLLAAVTLAATPQPRFPRRAAGR